MRALGVLGVAGICATAILLAVVAHGGGPELVLLACATGLGGILCLYGLWAKTMQAVALEKLRRRSHPDVAD